MLPDNRKELMRYRLDTAKERLNSAKILLESGSYKDSVGRSYYAMFTAVRALLALERVDYSKHSGVISHFQKEYIKTGIFDKKYSKYVSQAFQIRNNTDYADFFVVSQNDAKEQYEKAMEFYGIIEAYLLAEMKLLEILEEAQDDVDNGNTAPIPKTFEDIRENLSGGKSE